MVVLDPQREALLAREIHRARWKVGFRTRAHFLERLRHFYIKAAPLCDTLILPTDYLVQLLNYFGDIYDREFPAELPDDSRHFKKVDSPEGAYALLLRGCYEGMVAFTDMFPQEARRPIEGFVPPAFCVPMPVLEDDE